MIKDISTGVFQVWNPPHNISTISTKFKKPDFCNLRRAILNFIATKSL